VEEALEEEEVEEVIDPEDPQVVENKLGNQLPNLVD